MEKRHVMLMYAVCGCEPGGGWGLGSGVAAPSVTEHSADDNRPDRLTGGCDICDRACKLIITTINTASGWCSTNKLTTVYTAPIQCTTGTRVVTLRTASGCWWRLSLWGGGTAVLLSHVLYNNERKNHLSFPPFCGYWRSGQVTRWDVSTDATVLDEFCLVQNLTVVPIRL